MLRSTIHLPPIEEGEFLLCYVKTYLSRIYVKLNIKKRDELKKYMLK